MRGDLAKSQEDTFFEYFWHKCIHVDLNSQSLTLCARCLPQQKMLSFCIYIYESYIESFGS